MELLAVIVVLALFMSLQLCALARAKGQDRVTQCASNLRQFTLATILYANENNDKLPNNASVGFWAWDIPWKAGDELGKYGADWKVLYCPGTAPRFNATDNLNLYNYGPIIYHVIGYATTFPNTLTVSSTNWNSSLTSPATTASKRVLLADATISQAGQYSYSQRLTYNWTSINGGYPSAHISPHLNGAIPSGGNQSMLDGHVEWRPFDDMRCRVTGSSPGFWW